MNGQQNPLPALSVSASPLVFIVEGIATQMVADTAVTRLTAPAVSRLLASAVVVYVLYFM